jgi:hypothetical protein
MLEFLFTLDDMCLVGCVPTRLAHSCLNVPYCLTPIYGLQDMLSVKKPAESQQQREGLDLLMGLPTTRNINSCADESFEENSFLFQMWVLLRPRAGKQEHKLLLGAFMSYSDNLTGVGVTHPHNIRHFPMSV